MALILDREWTLPLVLFLNTFDDPAESAASKALAESRALRRLNYSVGKKSFLCAIAGGGRASSELRLCLEDGVVRQACDCPAPAACVHGQAAARVLLGEAFRLGSRYRREIKPHLPGAWRFGGQPYAVTMLKSAQNMFELDQSRPAPPGEGSGGSSVREAGENAASAAEAPPAFVEPGRITGSEAPVREKPKAWLSARGSNDEKPKGPPLRVVWKLLPAASGRLPRVAWQLLLRTPEGPERPCSARDIKKVKRELDQKSGAPWRDCRRLVEWLLDLATLEPPTELPVADRFGIFALAHVQRWLAAWGGSALVVWAGGEPLRAGLTPVAPAIATDAQGAPVWALSFPSANSSSHPAPALEPLTSAALFSDPENGWGGEKVFACRQGVVYPVALDGLSPGDLAAMRAASQARRDVFGDLERGQRLLRKLADAAAREAGAGAVPWAGVLPVRPVIELRHKRESWIQVAVYARARTGEVFLRSGPDQWEAAADPALAARWRNESPFANTGPDAVPLEPEDEVLAPPMAPGEEAQAARPAAPEPLLLLPRAADLHAAEAWLARLIPADVMPVPHGQGRFVFEWPSTAQAVASLARHWAERPRGAAYLGNPELEKLIDLRRRPALRIAIEPGSVDWLWVAAELEGELDRLSAAQLRAILAGSREKLIRLPDGRCYQRSGLEELQAELDWLEGLGIRPGEGRQRLHGLQWAGAVEGVGLGSLPGAGPLATLRDNLRRVAEAFNGIPPAPVAPETAAHLRPYQRAGADFLVWAGKSFGGALLADDMGLGKTLQVLAALTALRAEAPAPPGPALVVCPASVAHNWQREARRFCPGLRTLVLEAGAGRQRQLSRAARVDLVVSNYALARRDAARLRQVPWLLVCVDEAQAIKNPQSEIAAVVKSIPAQCRFALTGTPIENRLEDLVSIMQFAAPGALGRVRADELRDPEAQAALARLLRVRLKPVLLRRLKREVAPELPERIEERVDCEMGEEQRRLYLAEVARARGLLDGWDLPGGQERIHIFAALTRLRQLCCEPALLGHAGAGSGKVDELLDLLPVLLAEGHKVLLFSQFARLLDLLEGRLKQAGIRTSLLTGQTPLRERQALVDRFERDAAPGVFLISLKAGGAGLNLVSASHVVLFDPWWNPAVEAQAIDRSHRIGQDKTVVALRLVAAGTIEERILELQEKKRELVGQVLGGEDFNQALSREDIEFLLGESS